MEKKVESDITISVFKLPVSAEQAVGLQNKIDATKKWIEENGSKTTDATDSADNRTDMTKAEARLSRLETSKERREANPFGLFFDKDGNDNGSFEDLTKTHVELVEVKS